MGELKDKPKDAPKPVKPVNGKPDETKAQKFVRLAQRRVPRAIKVLEHVKNLANTAQYERTNEQTEKVLSAIDAAYKQLVNAYRGVKVSADSFKL